MQCLLLQWMVPSRTAVHLTARTMAVYVARSNHLELVGIDYQNLLQYYRKSTGIERRDKIIRITYSVFWSENV